MGKLERPRHGYEGYQNGGEIYNSDGDYHRANYSVGSDQNEKELKRKYAYEELKKAYSEGKITEDDYKYGTILIESNPLSFSIDKIYKYKEEIKKARSFADEQFNEIMKMINEGSNQNKETTNEENKII